MWKGKITIKPPKMSPTMPEGQKQQTAKAFAQLSKAVLMLNLKKGGTYELVTTGNPLPNADGKKTGTWTQKGNKLTVTQSGINQGRSQIFTLAPNGKSMTYVIPNGLGKVVFTR